MPDTSVRKAGSVMPSPLVVIIEDEADLAAIMAYNLRASGFEVAAAGTASEGLSLVFERLPALVLLDLMLPDMPGVDVCRALKSDAATRHIPVIIASAKGEEGDRVTGFEIGADDYVSKPFSVRELVLRVRAVLRRADGATRELLRAGPISLDPAAHRVTVASREVPLTALEFRLLQTLLLRRDRVQTRESLLSDVWGLELFVETRTVDTHVKRLREKLGDEAGGLIETVRGVGYRLTMGRG